MIDFLIDILIVELVIYVAIQILRSLKRLFNN